MIFKIGDKVRSIGGVEGEVIGAGDDDRSLMVKVPGVWRGTGVISIPMVRLKVIELYTVSSKRPRSQ
jgi:hypothetical protein